MNHGTLALSLKTLHRVNQMLRNTPTLEQRATSAYMQSRKLLEFFMAHAKRGYPYEAMTALEQSAAHLETCAHAFAKFPRLRPPIRPPRPVYTKPPEPIQRRPRADQGGLRIETPSPEQLQHLYDRS